ncbi:MAG: hypothetical protein JNM70_14465 [Anaerolineae bacterium]|nr:hypothetical protein [Anaerolineae bacterium]
MLLHTETRLRYDELEPESFIASVLYGPLREQARLVYTVVCVYTQIVCSLPMTRTMRVQRLPANVPLEMAGLRDILRHMRATMSGGHAILEGDDPTIPAACPAERYILDSTSVMRRNLDEVDRWAALIESDRPLASVVLPRLDGKSVGDMATDIRQRVHELNQALLFAQMYALRHVKGVVRH